MFLKVHGETTGARNLKEMVLDAACKLLKVVELSVALYLELSIDLLFPVNPQ